MAKFREIQNPQKMVDAFELAIETRYQTPYRVDGGGEIFIGNVGDWEIRYTDPATGAVYIGVVSADVFKKTYEPLDIDDEIQHITEEEMDVFHEAEVTGKVEMEEFINDFKNGLEQGTALVGQKL